MRCSSYCTADSYNLAISKDDFDTFKELGFETEVVEKVAYLSRNSVDNKRIDVFLFHFGCAIIWGATEQEELDILSDISFIENKRYTDRYYEYNNFGFNKDSNRTYIDEEKNVIYLENDSMLIKLSISHALAQSVKLNELEKFIKSLFLQTQPLQRELALSGRVKLSKNEISKQLGILFNARYSINMQSDILDTPEFFWRRPSLEPLYVMTVDFHDIVQRQSILNNHLYLIHELYTMLSSDLNHKHSTRLEIIIVILIAIEVFLALIKENLFEKFYSYFF